MVDHLIRPAHHADAGPRRLLRASTPYYTVWRRRHRQVVLDRKPAGLGHLGTIQAKVWRRHEGYLKRATPLERAAFYARILEERALPSATAVARELGEERHVVRRYLRLLELPEAIREYLAAHRTPKVVRYFSEARLRELVRIADPKAALGRFRQMMGEMSHHLRASRS